MAFDSGVFLGALEELSVKTTETFSLFHPAMKEIIEKKQLVRIQGPERTWIITPDGPGRVQAHRHGDELLQIGRRDNEVKVRETSGMATYSYSVELDEIERLNGKQDVVRLLKSKVGLGNLAFQQKVARQFVMGNEPGLDVFPTLNPQQTYESLAGYGVRGGLLAFGAPGAQTGNLHGINRNSVLNWHNQYAHINSFRSQGLQMFRRLHRRIAQQGVDQSKGARVTLVDDATFENYENWKDDRVIVMSKPEADKTDTGAWRGGALLLSDGTRMFADPFIDTSEMTGAAAEGVGYALDLDTWEFITHGGSMDSIDIRSGWFEALKPEKIPLQLAWAMGTIVRFGACCNNPRANGTITGGANA